MNAVRSNVARPAQTQTRTAATKAMPKNNDKTNYQGWFGNLDAAIIPHN
jgi:hypothetical protein